MRRYANELFSVGDGILMPGFLLSPINAGKQLVKLPVSHWLFASPQEPWIDAQSRKNDFPLRGVTNDFFRQRAIQKSTGTYQ
jgi:hypothetical protein